MTIAKRYRKKRLYWAKKNKKNLAKIEAAKKLAKTKRPKKLAKIRCPKRFVNINKKQMRFQIKSYRIKQQSNYGFYRRFRNNLQLAQNVSFI